MSGGYLHALSLFVHKGPHTKSMYQAQVNHRKVNFLALKYGTGMKNRSMIESFVNPRKDDTFDNSDAISFCLHGIEEHAPDEKEETDKSLMLMTPNAMRRVVKIQNPTTGEEEEKSAIGFGYAKDLRICDITADAWRQLLGFWGFTWVDEQGNQIEDERRPSNNDIYTFLSKLKNINLQTAKSFKQMIEEFCLSDLYQYDDNISLVQNIANFGALMRALVPIRVSVFEGQHRFYLIHNYLHGFYEVTSSIPLKRIKFEQAYKVDVFTTPTEVSFESVEPITCWAEKRAALFSVYGEPGYEIQKSGRQTDRAEIRAALFSVHGVPGCEFRKPCANTSSSSLQNRPSITVNCGNPQLTC